MSGQRAKPMTRAERERAFQRLRSLDGGFYESRWGVLSKPPIVMSSTPMGAAFAAVIDPDLPASDRERLTEPLRFGPRAHGLTPAPLGAFVGTLFIVLIVATMTGVGLPWTVLASLAAGTVAWLAVLRWLRRSATIPEDLRDRVITGRAVPTVALHGGLFAEKVMEMSVDEAVFTAAAELGEVENGASVDDEVETKWRQTWAVLRKRQETSWADRHAEGKN